MLGKSICILISGRAGVGKSTSASILVDTLKSLNSSVVVAPFASGVKYVASTGFYWNGNKDDKGRKLLQGIGAIGREYNPDIWVEGAMNHVAILPGYPFDFVLVDDWRFPNEYDYISKNGLYSVYKVRILAPNRELLVGTTLYNDVSETALTQDYGYDHMLSNTGPIEELKESLKSVLQQIFDKETYYIKE